MPGYLLALPAAKYVVPSSVLGIATVIAAIDANTIAVSLIAAVSGIISTIVGYKQWRAESLAEEARIDIDQAKLEVSHHDMAISRNDRLVDQLQEQLNAMVERETLNMATIRDLQTEVSNLQKMLVAYEIGSTRLIHQLQEAEIPPVWVPEN